MNMLYEAIKERGSMVIVPSSAGNDGIGRDACDRIARWRQSGMIG